MKDVSLGTFGVLVLILILMAKWVCLERMMSSVSVVWIVVIMTVSRAVMVEVITTLPYARKGEGMAGPFVEGASNKHRVVSHILALGLCLFFGPLGVALFVLAWLIIRLFGARCRKQFGGITGDLLGTANEMVEVLLLMICALPGKSILCYTGWAWVF
jgi:adenosylcobinamide-GDP ribazoletransferase